MVDAQRAGEVLKNVHFTAAYCSETTRAQQTAQRILELNQADSVNSKDLISSMAFAEQFYGYYEGRDMSEAWWAAGAPHGVNTYNAIVEKYGLSATRDFLKEADPFHDAESDEEYWERIESGYALIASNKTLHNGDHILQISHGNTLLSLMHRYAPEGYDLSERPRNGSVTSFDFETTEPIKSALHVVAYNR